MTAPQKTDGLTPEATVCTEPSKCKTHIPPRCGVCDRDGSQSANLGATWKVAPGRDGILSHLSDVLALSAAEIARKLQLPVAEVLGRLTALELDGAVRRHQDGYIRALRGGQKRA